MTMKTSGLVALTVAACVSVGVAAQTPKPTRVFVTDSQSWEVSGGFAASRKGAAGSQSGGARPQTAEVIKTVGESCKEVTVTIKQDNADYILMVEHEGGKGIVRKDNKWALFNKDGDAIGSGSTRALGNSVKDACKALLDDVKKKG
jgi:hypothetical protein